MTKPVQLSERVHRRLRRRKRPGESFNDAVDRLMSQARKDPLAFIERVPRSKVPAATRLADLKAERDAHWEQA